MSRALPALALAAALVTGAGAPSHAQPSGDLTVQVRVPWDVREGYTPVLVEALSKRPTELALTVTCEGYEAIGGDARASMTLALGAGVQTRRTILLPPLPYDIGRCHLLKYTSREGLEGSVLATAENQISDAALLVVDPGQTFDEANAEWHLGDRAAYQTLRHTRVLSVDPALLPARWQGYPDHVALLLLSEGDAALETRQREAIAAWSRGSGGLAVESEAQLTRWRALGARVERIDLDDKAALTGWLLDRQRVTANFNVELDAVPGTDEVPVDGFMVLVLLYALIAGPLNLWWVIRRRRRQLFLLTTPLLSVVTLVALLGYNLVSEGVDTRRVATQLHLLPDEGSTEAFSWSALTYFSPFPPSSIAVDPSTRVLPMNPEDRLSESNYHYYMDNPDVFRDRRYELAWGPDAQRLAGNWIPSRRNRQLLFAQPRAERARLKLARDGEHWVVTNGLGSDLRWLTWRTPDGRQLVVEQLAAGATARMSPRTEHLLEQLPSQLGPAAWRAWGLAALEPGWYRGQLEAPLGDLPGPEGTDETAPRVYVTGRLGPLPAEAGT